MIKNETPYKRYIYALDILAFKIGKPKQRKRVELMRYAIAGYLKAESGNYITSAHINDLKESLRHAFGDRRTIANT